jgi:hypothetical protein
MYWVEPTREGEAPAEPDASESLMAIRTTPGSRLGRSLALPNIDDLSSRLGKSLALPNIDDLKNEC